MSPVRYQPWSSEIRASGIRSSAAVCASPAPQYPEDTPPPRTRISPSSASFTSRPGPHLANRPLPEPERMVHADQRSRLGQPISLDRRIAEPSPELLSLAVERGAAGNKCPELPAELPANFAKRPPASQVVLLLG